MAVQYNPGIITDGLVLCLDAANLKSYPGSGNTCNDLSNIVGQSSFQNGTSFGLQNGGRFIFDGTDDRIQVPSPFGNIDWSSRAWSFSMWLKNDVLGDRGMITLNNNDASLYAVVTVSASVGHFWYFIKTSPSLTQEVFNTGSNPVPANTPYNFVMTYNGAGISPASANTGNIKFYINGVLFPTGLGGGASRGTLTEGIQLGGTVYPFDGDIHHFSMYNRVLTQDEVLQNFNALRGRFGI